MSLKGYSPNKDVKLDFSNKVTTLNPNAAEFVPSALKSTFANSGSVDIRPDVPGTTGKAVLGRSESNVSNTSDEEAHQFWCHQLPDDITPDFKVMEEEDSHGLGHLSFTGLSIDDGIETTRFSSSATNRIWSTRQDMLPLGIDGMNLSEKVGRSSSIYPMDQSSAAFMTSASWDKQFINGDQQHTYGRLGKQYNGDFSTGFLNDLGDNAVIEGASINHLEFLESEFPGFSMESLADVYYANGCNLNLTIEFLTQLKLQVDGGFSQNKTSKPLSAPSLSLLPALPVADPQNGLSKYTGADVHQAPSTCRSSTSLFEGTTDFAKGVRRLATQESVHWKFERNGSADSGVGTSRKPSLLDISYNGNKKLIFEDEFIGAGAARADAVWLGTGEAVANIYSESREEARDFASLRNAYFEQASQACLVGKKALAKELSFKGQVYNLQMKAAHGKARETIYRHSHFIYFRNPISVELQKYGQEQDHLIDLHGLHVSEAVHVLKHELSILRNTARSSGQQLKVMICMGMGHHTNGSQPPARLPLAVEQYLLEEGLHYTVPQ